MEIQEQGKKCTEKELHTENFLNIQQDDDEALPSAKAKGNEEYHKKEYEKAIEHWLRAYRSCRYILSKNVYSEMPEKENEIKTLKMQLDSNLSIAYLKLKDYPNAIHYANQALEYNPKNMKALHHKSEALFEMCEYKKCVESVDIALDIEPNNSIFKKIKHNALVKQREYISKSKKMSEALFENKMSLTEENKENSITKFFKKAYKLLIQSSFESSIRNIVSKICPIRLFKSKEHKND